MVKQSNGRINYNQFLFSDTYHEPDDLSPLEVSLYLDIRDEAVIAEVYVEPSDADIYLDVTCEISLPSIFVEHYYGATSMNISGDTEMNEVMNREVADINKKMHNGFRFIYEMQLMSDIKAEHRTSFDTWFERATARLTYVRDEDSEEHYVRCKVETSETFLNIFNAR